MMELNRIYTGDARELARAIPDESIDLIFTDPVYDQIEDYRWLAETAVRVLKPDSACLVFYEPSLLPETINAMNGILRWRHQLALYMPGLNMRYAACNLFRQWRGCLVFGKGTPKVRRAIRDYAVDGNPAFLEAVHRWAKNPNTLIDYADAFTHSGATVLDPFTGGGTVPAVCKMLGRNYLAFEIDPATAELARQRVAQAQPPLLIPQPEQMEIAL
jgi:site-specific DNA-methyltransferase (adenine-specific)